MELVDIIGRFVDSAPLLAFAMVLLNREMKKREEAEGRERELLYEVAQVKIKQGVLP